MTTRHPLDQSPRIPRVHLWDLDRHWELNGKDHMRCGICHLIVPDAYIGALLPSCRPDGANADLCVASDWLSGHVTHSDDFYAGEECAVCGAPSATKRPCEHSRIDFDGAVATCAECGKTMKGW